MEELLASRILSKADKQFMGELHAAFRIVDALRFFWSPSSTIRYLNLEVYGTCHTSIAAAHACVAVVSRASSP